MYNSRKTNARAEILNIPASFQTTIEVAHLLNTFGGSERHLNTFKGFLFGVKLTERKRVFVARAPGEVA